MNVRLLVACALFGCSQQGAPAVEPDVSTPDASAAIAPTAASGSSGAAVGVSSADALKDLHHSLSRSTKNLRIERRGARVHIETGGTFQTATIMTYDDEGHASRHCLDSPRDLDRMMGEAP